MDISGPPVRTRLAAVIAVAIAAIAPGLAIAPAADAQSAGDDQYQDPIVGGDGGRDSQPQADPGGEAGSAPITPSTGAQAPSAESAPAPQAAPSSALPRTGADADLLAGLGVALLMAGALTRVRVGERARF